MSRLSFKALCLVRLQGSGIGLCLVLHSGCSINGCVRAPRRMSGMGELGDLTDQVSEGRETYPTNPAPCSGLPPRPAVGGSCSTEHSPAALRHQPHKY